MHQPIPPAEPGDDRLFSPRRLVIFGTAALWIAFACALPLQNANEARRQAHLQLTQVLTAGKPKMSDVIAAFDRATKDVIAASTVPCLVLSVCIIFLINRLLQLKRRYNALEHDLRTCRSDAAGPDDAAAD